MGDTEILLLIGGVLIIFYLYNKKSKDDFTENGHEILSDIFKKWRPVNCNKESDYEYKLQKKLRKDLKKFEDDNKQIKINTQFGIGRRKVDLMIDKKFLVELKYNLKTTNEFDRLIGQLTEYLKTHEGENIFLILCGKTEEDILQDIQSFCRKMSITVITKN